MCGISGIFSSNPTSQALVRSSIDAISHRGPDEEGYFQGDRCTLGMCRLSIIDVASGHQPNFNKDKSIVSVFNGEIYNFVELRKHLQRKGYKLETYGDSALIPYLYEEFGVNFPQQIQGMFAIAIFDLNKNQMILSRDRMGEKPLWYYVQKGELKFSSELKGLFELDIEKRFDESCIPEYLRFGFINAPRSPYLNVQQLPPASTLIHKDGSTTLMKYWRSSDVLERDIGYQDAMIEIENLLRDSVRSRLVSERPIGSFLSGGIDSTLVTALMQRESASQVHTFSVGFQEKKYDEANFAKSVAISIGSKHHELILRPDPNFIHDELAYILDQPFADSSIIPTFMLSQFARESVVVALSGDGGDESFAGYERYRAGFYFDKINPLLRANPLSFVPSSRITNDKFRKLIRHSSHNSLLNRYIGFQSLFQTSDLESILRPEFPRLYNNDFYKEIFYAIQSTDKIRKLQELDMNTYLPGDLMYKVDIASMANGLEVRSPFLDYRVVEFGLSLPRKFKVKIGSTKFLLRQLAKNFVPEQLIDRPKQGFGIPRAEWIRGDLKQLIWGVLLDDSSRDRGWFQIDRVERILKKHQEGENLDFLIWPLFMLELWAKKWID